MKKPQTKFKNPTDTSINSSTQEKKESLLLKFIEKFIKPNVGDQKNKPLSKRLSLDYPINFDTLSPGEKLYAGIMASYRESNMYEMQALNRQNKIIEAQYRQNKDGLSLIASMIRTTYSEGKRAKELQILVYPSHQGIIPQLEGYFPAWEVTIEKVNPKVNSLVPLPILVKFKRRSLD